MKINEMKAVFFLTFLCSVFMFSSCSVDEITEPAEDVELELMKAESLSWTSPSDDPNAVIYLSKTRTYSQEILDEVEALENQGKQVIYLTDKELTEMSNGNLELETVSNRDIDCVYSSSASAYYYAPSNILFYSGSITSMTHAHWYGVAIYGCGTPYYAASASGDYDFYNNQKTVTCGGTWANHRNFAYCSGWELGTSVWAPL